MPDHIQVRCVLMTAARESLCMNAYVSDATAASGTAGKLAVFALLKEVA